MRNWCGCVPWIALALVAALNTSAWALTQAVVPAAGTDVVLTLENGDVIRGRVVAASAEALTIDHVVIGAITIPLGRIRSLDEAPAGSTEASPPDAAAPPAEPAPPPPPPEARLSFTQGWKGSVEAGISGSDGNSETFNGRAGLNLERITDEMELRFGAFYVYTENDGRKSQSRGELSFRNDWNFRDSPWGWFLQAKAEYDEFQDWNWRLSAFTGPIYALIRTESTTLRLRGGVGATREFGGDDDDIVPEALAGVDFRHRFSERRSVFVNYEYLPSLTDFPEYRMITKAGYEIVIDPEASISLKLGVEDRYDSDPGPGRKKNDIDYFALLAWSF